MIKSLYGDISEEEEEDDDGGEKGDNNDLVYQAKLNPPAFPDKLKASVPTCALPVLPASVPVPLGCPKLAKHLI